MAIKSHIQIFRRGVKAWNNWRAKKPRIRPDLSYAKLSETDLFDWTRGPTDLRRINFKEANLAYCSLGGADLHGANLSKADLSLTDLSGTDLTRANLRSANLFMTNLTSSILRQANFDLATIAFAQFGNVDLRPVRGLETVTHNAPSVIGVDTIYRSGGDIPEIFMRGTGLPDEFIAYVRSLVTTPIEFNSCFISHSTKDQEFVKRLHADLQANGVRCWFAPQDIKGGKRLHDQIDDAINIHERLLLILSENSINSPWVMTEISKARKRENTEKRQMLFPIRLIDFDQLRAWKCFDADNGVDTAKEIREYYIPDFSNWKMHDSYQNAFNRLLRDLKKAS